MTDHRIRTVITPAGVLCSICDRAVVWVRSTDPRHEPHVGYWDHADELDASMARHPAGKGRP